ncbi:MAG: flippase-like domain-containing protein [Chloroflexi bacterium]|nr:flippase-like domain-containing protein [Chloroflexota bacterium]
MSISKSNDRRTQQGMTWIGILVSVLFLYLAFRGVDWHTMWSALLAAEYFWIFPAQLSLLAGFLVITWRWQRLLRPAGRVPTRRAFNLVMISYLINYVLPGRLGELGRAYLVGQDGISRMAALATVVLEKVFDGLVILLALALASLMLPLPAWGHWIGLAGLALFGSAFLITLLWLRMETRGIALLTRLVTPFSKRLADDVAGMAQRFTLGLATLQQGQDIFAITTFSLLHWTTNALVMAFTLRAFRFDVPFIGAVLLMAVLGLGTTVPSAPGALGTYQWLAVQVLGLFAVDPSSALTFAFVLQFSQTVTIVLVGGLAMLWEGTSVGRIRRYAERY